MAHPRSSCGALAGALLWLGLAPGALWAGPLGAGPLGTVVRGKPQEPLPALASGLTFSSAVHGQGNRVFLIGSQFVFELTGGQLVRVAGCGLRGFAGDGGAALEARLRDPTGIGMDSRGDLYIVDAGNFRVRKVDVAAGTISTVAGSGLQGPPAEGELATTSPLGEISALAVDPAGNIWLADASRFQIFLIDARTGRIERVAGSGEPGFDGDGAPALTARLDRVAALATDGGRNLWIATPASLRVLHLEAATGLLRTVAGGGTVPGDAADGADATLAALRPDALALDSAGNLFLADSLCSWGLPPCVGCPVVACPGGLAASDLIRRVEAGTGTILTIAGGGVPEDGVGDGNLPREARFADTRGISVGPGGRLVVVDGLHRRLRVLDVSFSSVATSAGNGAERFAGDGGSSLEALLARPRDVQIAPGGGRLWIADTGNDRIRLATRADGLISTVAGGGSPVDGIGDGLPANEAALRAPHGVATDSAGNLWIADTENGRVRRVDAATSRIESVAGQEPDLISGGDGGPARNAHLLFPVDVAVSPGGEYFISDAVKGSIRRVDAGGTISTYAGGGADLADGVPAKTALLSLPGGLALDSAGNLYIAEEGASRVRIVDRATATIRTVAGSEGGAVPGGSLLAPSSLVRPQGLVVDAAGNLWIGDAGARRVFRLDAISRAVSPVAGSGKEGSSPDGVAAPLADLGAPSGVAIDVTGELIFVDSANEQVRTVPVTEPPFSLEPASGSLSGGLRVTITGAGLAPGATTVRFGGKRAEPVEVLDATRATAVVPPGTSPAAAVEVSVSTVDGLVLIPGGFTYINDPPVAVTHPIDPDSGYFVPRGGGLTLDGTASSDPNAIAGDSIATYEWDLDGDGAFDVLGPTPALSAAELSAFGLSALGVYRISLRVRDQEGEGAVASTNVTLADLELTPASGSLSGGYPGRITGSGLTGVVDVLFGSAPVRDLQVSLGLLTFTVPAGHVFAGPVDVGLVLGGQRRIFSGAFTYINDPPVARAASGGAYNVRLDGTLVLDGTGSSDPNEVAGDAVALHEWDLDGDGRFDRSGPKVRLTAAELAAFPLGRVGTTAVLLQVTDRNGASDSDNASVVVKEAATRFPNEDFSRWKGDADRNKIDDKIDALADSERIDIIVVLEHGSDLDAAAARLAPVSTTPPAVIPAISALCLKGVLAADVRGVVGAESGLFRAEAELEIEADLDVSSAAIRAASSPEFSPDTCHDRNVLGAGVNIAILDSGVDDTHPSLAGKYVAGFDAFTDSLLPPGSQSNPDDDFQFGGIFHGTHVAGIAMGVDPIYKGVAPAAKLVDVKVLDALGRGTTASVLLGLQWCIDHKDFPWAGQPTEHRGIDVVNLSVGARERSDGKDSLSMMVDAAVARGLVVVAAAGNSAALGPGFGAPGAADLAITVGALDDHGTVDRGDDTIRPSSSFGPRIDDGDSDLIEELKPDVVAPGTAIESPNGNVFAQPASGFTALTGSSAASAHVAGVVALLLEGEPRATPATIKSLLRNTAEPRGAPFDSLLDPTYNELHGKGITDAFGALPEDLGNANRVWVARSADDSVVAVTPDPSPTPTSSLSSGSPYPIGGGREPYGVAVDGRGNVWLANRLNSSVTKMSSAGQVRFVVALGPVFGAVNGSDVGGIAVDRDNDVWLTLTTTGRVIRVFADGSLDPASRAVGGGPVAVAADRHGNLWTANASSGNVTKLDHSGAPASGSPFAVGSTPSAIVCDRAGRAYVANLGSDTVTILEPSGALVGSFPAGPRPIEISIGFGGQLWVANDLEATLTRLDSDGSNALAVPVGAGPRGLAIAGDGTVFASIFTVGIGATVTRVKSDGGLLETISVGPGPINHGDGTGFVHASSVDPDGDADGDGWSNAEEIDAFTNPFHRRQHPLVVTMITPSGGSVNGGTLVRIEGTGLEAPVTVEIGGAPAPVLGAADGALEALTPPGSFPPGGSVDVTVRRPEGSSATLPAAYLYENDDPVADADPDSPDDGYVVLLGDALVLDGRASHDPNAALGDGVVSYDWSLNGNAVLGPNPTLSAATLSAFGMGVVGGYLVTLTVEDSLGAQDVAATTVRVVDPSDPRFLRSDSNQDGSLQLSDAVYTLQWLFQGMAEPACREAANANGDARIDIADAIWSLSYLFQGGPPPLFPFPACANAPAPLGCHSTSCP